MHQAPFTKPCCAVNLSIEGNSIIGHDFVDDVAAYHLESGNNQIPERLSVGAQQGKQHQQRFQIILYQDNYQCRGIVMGDEVACILETVSCQSPNRRRSRMTSGWHSQ